jgi:hypothetical protein
MSKSNTITYFFEDALFLLIIENDRTSSDLWSSSNRESYMDYAY